MKNLESVIVMIRERIDYEALFGEFLELKGRGAERMALCVFHKNTDSPALSINVEDGLFDCKNPECGAKGDFISFYQRVRSLTFKEAVHELARRVGVVVDSDPESGVGLSYEQLRQREEAVLAGYRPRLSEQKADVEPDRVIDESIIEAMHQRLLGTPALIEMLASKRGLTQDTIEKYQIGHDGQRFYIPVRNAEGACVNIRRYKPDAKQSKNKMISWREGFGSARLFPVDKLNDNRPIYLFEGEMDCLLARQHGLNALTTTGGAGTWRDSWNSIFEGKDVVICYDADDAGRQGAVHVANRIAPVAERVRITTIPLAEPPGADFTDYIVGHGHTLGDFLSLVEQSRPFQVTEETRRVGAIGEPETLHLSQASRAEHYNMPVRMNVIVSGKTTSPYLIPREVRVGCPSAIRGTLKMCERCPVAAAGGPVTERLEFESNDVLTFTNVPDQTLQRAIKTKVGVPAKCGYAKHDVLEAMNIEEVQLIPEIERTEAAAPYVTTPAFYMGHGLQANRSYVMTGITVPEPKRQLATHLIHTALQSQADIDTFRLTDDVVRRLKAFQPESNGLAALWTKLGDIYDDLEKHTRVYQRRDLMLAVDLVFHSILQFRFQGELLKRGWTEALIIGDSRTGKTSIVQRVLDHYGAGEFTTGENTSLAGLVGGLHQIGTTWVIQWGRIPLNDRRLLAVDEAGNIPTDQISRMSAMRSSGIAEVIKIHTERTNARTRQIWISNPRSPRPLSSYSQGVLAVKELIGAPEDIARFDLVVSAASGDVPLAVVNAAREQEHPSTYTSDLCHQRVMWAWSRSSDQVVWSDGATETVLRLATEQGEKYRYATEIPLVEPNEQRVKMARLAVATAALFFSASDDGSQVVVKPEHAEFAAQLLETLYSKRSLSFTEYAQQQHTRYVISESDDVQRIVTRNPGAALALMQQEQFTQRDFEEIFAISDRIDLRQTLTVLKEAGFLRRVGSSFYVKTPAAINWLRQEISGNGHGEQVDFAGRMEEPLPAEPAW